MPVKIAIVTEEKSKNLSLEPQIEAYKKRMRHAILIKELSPKKLPSLLLKPGRHIALDRSGSAPTSEKFAEQLFKGEEKEFYFYLGNAAGFSPGFLEQVNTRLCLSSLTFPQHIARFLLVEQIYRASEIRKGSAYHK